VKVVLFCGGMGLRAREVSQRVPKPMIPIGGCPLLLHIMRYYAHYGHRDFILCLGYQGQLIKEFFLNYREALLHDFVLERGGTVELQRRELDEWRIAFVDTGLRSNIGERLKAVQRHLAGEEMFLANYADGLSDAPLPELVENLRASGKTGSFLAVKPTSSFHVVSFAGDRVKAIEPFAHTGLWINGGFFAFRQEIFAYMGPGEELVEQPFNRLIADNELVAYRYGGFWAAMDTLKDHLNLEALCEAGQPPWAVWAQTSRPAEEPRREIVWDRSSHAAI